METAIGLRCSVPGLTGDRAVPGKVVTRRAILRVGDESSTQEWMIQR